MKLKKIKSEIKAGKKALKMYDNITDKYPREERNKDVFEINEELNRLQNLHDLKVEKKIAKLKNNLAWC
jgi:NAD-dependent SIR2 family protein deacetylase